MIRQSVALEQARACLLYHLKSFSLFGLESKNIERHAQRFKNHFCDTAEGLRETCHYFSMLSLQHRAYCSLISCSPCEFASTDGKIGSLEANTACILLTLSGGKSFINWDAFSLSLSLSLPPPQTHNRCKQARWEWVHVWFGCCHGLFSPVRDAASIIVILPRSLPLPTQPSWQQFLPLSQCRGGTSLPLAGCPPGNFFSCKLQMFLLLWQWVDSRLRERNCRVWRIQRPLHFLTARTSSDKTSGWLESAGPLIAVWFHPASATDAIPQS